MKLSRREFLKAATASGCLLSTAGISSLAYAVESREGPLLTVLFLRGGADGLHLLGPADDPDYIAARPPELRVTDSGDKAGIALDHGLSDARDFRLHADAAPLAGLYRAGRLGFVHAVGLTDATRSHFVAQDLIERGIADEKRIGSVDTGWLARAMGGLGGLVPGYSATASTAFAMRGFPASLATPDISTGLGLPWGDTTAKLLRAMSADGGSVVHRAGIEALDVLASVDRKLPRDGTGKVLPYQASGHASYDGAGDLSRTLASVARLSKMQVGLAVACVDYGGWDTHEGQPGRFANQARQLSTGLTAFHDDMAASGRKAVTVVMTEFGRRFRANKSNGTDHGHGACWLVMGDGIRGGRMFGKWPGLAAVDLDQGVDLAVTTDYRTVLSEVIALTGLPGRSVFRDWQSKAEPLGLAADQDGQFRDERG